MKRILTAIAVAMMMLMPTAAFAGNDNGNNGKKADKVYVCHFPGHEGDVYTDADNYPPEVAQDYCEDVLEGTFLTVSANALNGHDATEFGS